MVDLYTWGIAGDGGHGWRRGLASYDQCPRTWSRRVHVWQERVDPEARRWERRQDSSARKPRGPPREDMETVCYCRKPYLEKGHISWSWQAEESQWLHLFFNHASPHMMLCHEPQSQIVQLSWFLLSTKRATALSSFPVKQILLFNIFGEGLYDRLPQFIWPPSSNATS